jgi:probable HAF family extracellular repeat protein
VRRFLLAAITAAVVLLPSAASASSPPPIDIGTLGRYPTNAWRVNDNGEVAGTSAVAFEVDHGFFWTQDTGMVDIGTLGGA